MSSARPTPSISAGRLDRPPAVLGGGEHAGGGDDRQERGEPRLDPSPQRVRHDLDPAQEAVGDVARAGERVGGRKRPLRGDAGERERARLVGERGHACASGRARSSRPRSRARARRRGARAAGRAGSRAGTRSRRSPARVPFTRALDAEAPFRGGASRAARPTARPAGRRARAARGGARRARPRRAGGSRRGRAGRSTRAARSAAAGAARAAAPRRPRRRPRARSATRSPRPGPAPTTVTVARVLVRLVGVHGARVAAQLLGHVQPRMARRDAARGGRRPRRRARSRRRPRGCARSGLREGSGPSRSARAASSTWARNSSTRRVVPVERPRRRAARGERPPQRRRTASPGNAVGRQWPSLSERISRCRIAAARRRHGAGRVALGPEDGDLLRLEPAAAQRLVRREPGEPASRRRAHAAIYFTEPASRPWTK